MATVMLQSVNNLIFMPPFTDLEGQKDHLWYSLF